MWYNNLGEKSMQINRLFEIIYTLLHKKKVSATELAEQLGVSRRTIYRDIDTLSIAGILCTQTKDFGTETGRSKSADCCHYCYADDEFVTKQTLAEAVESNIQF